MSDFLTLILPIVAAILTASYLYVVKTSGSTPENFDLIKFSSTVIVGTGIGVFAYVGNVPITADNIGFQLVALSGLIIVVENGIKLVVRTAVKVNISALAPFLPAVPAPAAASARLVGVKTVAACAKVEPVAAPAPSGCSGSGCPAPVDPAPVVVTPPAVDPVLDPVPVLPANKIDTLDHVAVKFYPAVLQGVSPYPVTVHAVADPAEGVHEVVRGIIDWGDKTPVETFEFSHGVARLTHSYEFVQRGQFDGRDPCRHYAHEFYPVLSVVSRDGLTTTINNKDGRSLMITVKDAEAVASGKVTNYPFPNQF